MLRRAWVRRFIEDGFARIDGALVLTVRRDDLGRLAAGTLADLVWWDETWRPRRVWIGGREVALHV